MRRLKLMLPLSMIFAACGGASNGPAVSSTVPTTAGMAVAINLPITATFNRAMNPTTLNASTFLLKQGATNVPGAVSYAGDTAKLTPTNALAPNTSFTATLTTGCKDTTGVALSADYTWTFTTVANGAPPDVSSTEPLNAAANVWSGQQIAAVFNEAMDATTLTTTTFSVLQGSTAVPGQVSYTAATNTATFAPSAPLGASLPYTAKISTGAKNASGISIAAAYSWTFDTRSAGTTTPPVNLGSAGNFVILAETKISTVPTSAVTGDLGISPNAAGSITGFSLTEDSTNTFSSSSQVTGKVYAADYMPPTASNLTTAITDMMTAFTDAAGRAPDVTELGAGNIGGMTLAPGVYKWGTGLLIPTDVHLAGGATDVWIFDIAQDLNLSSATSIVLTGGALAKNVFWQVSGLAALGTTSHFEGVLLCGTGIALQTGASVNGRLLAQSAVSIDGSTILQPTP